MSAFLCPILAVAINVIVQVIAYRSRRGGQYFRSIVEGFIAGAVAFIILDVVLACGRASSRENILMVLLVSGPIYVALSYCAYNFTQLGQTSIRIRIYLEISAAGAAGLSIQEINREYNDEGLLQVRLQRLIEGRDLEQQNGRYIAGRRRFVIVSAIILGARRFLLGREGEIE